MDDYISREAALTVMERLRDKCGNDEMAFALNWASGLLRNVPTTDVVEVRHASWMAENSRPKSGIFYCSCCHRTCYDPQPTRAKGWTKRCRYHYCPNCGAKMDGGQDNV